MDIAIRPRAIEFDEQAVDLVVGSAFDLSDVAKFLAVGTDDIGIEQLCFAEAEGCGYGTRDGGACLGGALKLVFGCFILVGAGGEEDSRGGEGEESCASSFLCLRTS